MEMQQIIGMLARINARMEEILSANRAESKAIQGKADADRVHMPEVMTTNQKWIETKMDAIQEKKDVNLRENIVEMKNEIKEAIRGEMKPMRDKRTGAHLEYEPTTADMKACQ
jgi:hypothetical protein